MTELVILAYASTERARFLYGHPILRRSLIGYASWVLKSLFPKQAVSLATDSEALGVVGRELGLEVVLEFREELDFSPGFRLTLKPHRGPISPERTRQVHQTARRSKQRAVSAMRLHANCNPAWLMTLPQKALERDLAKLEFPNPAVQPIQTNGVGSAKVPGSQWLPEIYLADGAVAASPDSPRKGKVLWVKDDPMGHPETPLFYRLPLFWMDEDTKPLLDICGGSVNQKAWAGMFAPYDPYPTEKHRRITKG